MSSAASAYTVSSAVLEGDVVPGVGTVTRIDNLAVNDLGDYLVEADTDNANADIDVVVLGPGGLVLQEGQSLALPVGATLDSFDAINLNNNGDSGFNFFLDGTSGTNDDSGIYFNDHLVLQEGTISGSPDFSPGTPYIGFFEALIDVNNSNQIFVVASIDDPGIASTVDRALVIMNLDGSGNLVSESVIAKEADVLPGQVEGVNDFGTGPHQIAFNDLGQALYFADVGANSATDGCIYRNLTLVAQEGSPSPVGGRNYELLSSRGLDMSNSGAIVFKANLDGATTDDEVIILNGAVFRQEGQTLPSISPFLLTAFGTGSGPVQVDNAGNVLWFGDWDDPNTGIDTGLFLNDELLIQEGVTKINDLLVTSFNTGQDGFQLSNNGQFAMFEATLEDGTNGAFLIQFDGPVAVTLSQLAAVPAERSVDVSWVTSAQVNHDGFHVYRANSRTGEQTRLTDEMIRGGSSYRYVDRNVRGNATYFYWIGAVELGGAEQRHGPVRVDTPNWLVRVSGLMPAAPNPFVGRTDLRFYMEREGEVRLDIVDVSGRLVRTFDPAAYPVGEHALRWDGRDGNGRPMPAGVYFTRLHVDGATQTGKVVNLGN
jgi:hypothetical protein